MNFSKFIIFSLLSSTLPATFSSTREYTCEDVCNLILLSEDSESAARGACSTHKADIPRPLVYEMCLGVFISTKNSACLQACDASATLVEDTCAQAARSSPINPRTAIRACRTGRQMAINWMKTTFHSFSADAGIEVKADIKVEEKPKRREEEFSKKPHEVVEEKKGPTQSPPEPVKEHMQQVREEEVHEPPKVEEPKMKEPEEELANKEPEKEEPAKEEAPKEQPAPKEDPAAKEEFTLEEPPVETPASEPGQKKVEIIRPQGSLGLELGLSDTDEDMAGAIEIRNVMPTAPEDVKAVFQPKDKVLEINGVALTSLQEMQQAIFKIPVGGKLLFLIHREHEAELSSVEETDEQQGMPEETFEEKDSEISFEKGSKKIAIAIDGEERDLVIREGQLAKDAILEFCQKYLPDSVDDCAVQLGPLLASEMA